MPVQDILYIFETELIRLAAMNRIILVLILLLISINANHATELSDSAKAGSPFVALPDSESMPKWHSMVTNLPGDMLSYYRYERDHPHYLAYTLITLSTAALIVTDPDTYAASDKIYRKSRFLKNWSDTFTKIGDGRSQFGMAAIFAAYGFLGKDQRSLKTASQIVEAVLASGSVVQVLKHITGRESPLVSTIAGGKWRWFPNQMDYAKRVPHYDAFPSGHICTSVAAYTVIAENYPECEWITPAGYIMTGLIACGLANTGIHWWSDFPLGIALGYSFGKLISHPGGLSYASEDKETRIEFMPFLNQTSSGLSLCLCF